MTKLCLVRMKKHKNNIRMKIVTQKVILIQWTIISVRETIFTRKVQYRSMTQVAGSPVIAACSQDKSVTWQLFPIQLNGQVTLHA